MKLYCNPFSQPARAIHWLCLLLDIPHEYISVDIAKVEHRKPQYAKLNPTKKLPFIEDDGFIIYESHSILRYLSEKYGKSDEYYPKDLKQRTCVDMYLDWHHSNLRAGAAGTVFNTFFGPKITGYKVPGPGTMKMFDGILERSLKFIDREFLKDGKYINGLDSPSIADLSCYCEIASLKLIKYNFDSYPNVKTWMSKMEDLKYFGDSHKVLLKVTSKL